MLAKHSLPLVVIVYVRYPNEKQLAHLFTLKLINDSNAESDEKGEEGTSRERLVRKVLHSEALCHKTAAEKCGAGWYVPT